MTTTVPTNSHTINGVRPLNFRRDMPQVMRLLNEVFGPTLDAEGRRALNSMSQQPAVMLRFNQMGSRTIPGFIWEMGGEIVGNISVIPTKTARRVIIANVAVSPDCRRQGIARGLMETSLRHIKRRRMDTVLLQVDVTNKGAIRLYESLGFVPMGGAGYWTAAPGEWRELPSSPAYETWPVRAEDWLVDDIRPIHRHEHKQAYLLDLESQQIDLNWPDIITPQTYKTGFRTRADNFFNGKQFEAWVVSRENQLVGLGAIWSEWGRPHRLVVRVPKAFREELTRPLFAKLLRRLRYLRRRHITIEHTLDDEQMAQLIHGANFRLRRNLMTMKLLL